MTADFSTSKTRENLMKAFAGESQARNRYTFAASCAEKNGLYVVKAAFQFTADQEKEHAEIFYKHLAPLAGNSITVDGSYPVDLSSDVACLLRAAQHNEEEEYGDVYKSFEKTAREEASSRLRLRFIWLQKWKSFMANVLNCLLIFWSRIVFLFLMWKLPGCAWHAATSTKAWRFRNSVPAAGMTGDILSGLSWLPGPAQNLFPSDPGICTDSYLLQKKNRPENCFYSFPDGFSFI